ncbi:MAG: hypothetical protein H0T89_20585 [Deltaproteobacteria bacterium]|nr:hypothetical protein [Deltaproteobacteria bacterium]MDQ3297580.1 hypothetical protein [Myxococcota bacterium]
MKLRVGIAVVIAFGCKAKSEDAGEPVRQAPLPSSPEPADAGTHSGAHPDYPTPVAAGTDKIFSTEDPDRGPTAPLDFKMPPAGQLTWTEHEHCVDDITTVRCSPAVDKPQGMWTWRVGRKGKTLVVAQELHGGQLGDTKVYVTKPNGTPDQQVIFDDHRRVKSARLFTGDGRYSRRNRDGSNGLDGCGYMGYSLDDRDRVIELRCLQWLGEPMRDTSGVAVTRFALDDDGFVLAEHRFGIAGTPIAGTDGVTRYVYELDDVGRRLVALHHDADGGPVADDSGCFGTRFERDERGVVIRRVCMGADGKPARSVSNIAVTAYKHDRYGCRLETRHFDPDGAPAIDHAKSHGTNDERNRFCELTSRTCVGSDGVAIACGPGLAAKIEYKLDVHGNALIERNFDADGEPTTEGSWGAYEVRNKWDDRGNAIRIACFAAGGRPQKCSITDFHAKESTYDEAGREVSEIYFDARGERTTNIGITMRRFQYDNYDHTFEARNYDEDGALVDALGFAVRRDLYDDAHRLFGVLLFDSNNRPAAYTGCFGGTTCPETESWHAVRVRRRSDGTVASNQFFDANGQLLETFDCTRVMCFDD